MTQEADDLVFRPKSKKGPFIITGVAAFVAGALFAAIVTAASMSGDGKDKRGKRAVATASAAPSGSAATVDGGAAEKKPPATLAERAMDGDAAAIKKLRALPRGERTADDVLALNHARAEDKRKEISELARKIELVPKLAKEDKDVAQRLSELSKDDVVAPDLLAAYAKMKGKAGPDLLYHTLTKLKRGDTADLAEELLYAKDVRKKASRPMSVVLEIREAEKCDDMHKALERAKLVGDRRAIVPMVPLFNKRGCGDKKLDDCWPCLRGDDTLKDAAAAVQKRSPEY